MNATASCVRLAPRRWQTAALERWTDAKRGVVSVVTGGGKTVFAHLCIENFRSDYPDGRVAIVVPTTALQDQWVVSLIEDAGIAAGEIGCYSAEEKPAEPARFNVLVVNTARRATSAISKTGTWMLVADECHRMGSPENAKALSGHFVATLGLSATPERDYDDGFERWVRPVLGPIIYEYGYVDAAHEGVISPFALHNIRVRMLSDETSRFDVLSKRIRKESAKLKRGLGSEDRLTRLLQQRGALLASVTMRIPVAAKLAEQHLGQRTIIFHERVAAAEAIAEVLAKRHRSVALYHTRLSPDLRRDNLRLYRRGIFDILVCCRALDEGINVPETAVAIVASSTASTRQRIQRLGRVLRPAPGKDFADIYTIYASDLEEERLKREEGKLASVTQVSWAKVR
jgi:superfamily II DNA or RNA helicase